MEMKTYQLGLLFWAYYKLLLFWKRFINFYFKTHLKKKQFKLSKSSSGGEGTGPNTLGLSNKIIYKLTLCASNSIFDEFYYINFIKNYIISYDNKKKKVIGFTLRFPILRKLICSSLIRLLATANLKEAWFDRRNSNWSSKF